MVSASALVAAARKRLNSKILTPEAIFKAEAQRDPVAVEIVGEFLKTLAAGLNNYIFLWAPDVIVLAGGLSNGLAPYLSRLRSLVIAKPYKSYRPRIVLSTLKESAGVIGAANCVSMSILNG